MRPIPIKAAATVSLVVGSVCVLVLALAGCTAPAGQAQSRSEVPVPMKPVSQLSRIPPLDEVMPTETETAAFALG